MYGIAGDRTAWSEWIAIWPATLWCFGLLPLTLLSIGTARGWQRVLGVLAFATFACATFEWHPLARTLRATQTQQGEATARRLRVLIWNVAGEDPLTELDRIQPDVCFFQETPALDPSRWSTASQAYLSGVADTAVLSRYPLTMLPTRGVGPWTAPLILRVDLPDGGPLLLINVRLMLPGLVLDVLNDYDLLASAHRRRVAQFPALAALIDETRRHTGIADVVLAGDFNTQATAASLDPLRAKLTDVWPGAGRGWGMTITAAWPLARIDQCWITGGLRALDAHTERGTISDHRLLVVDLLR